MRLLVSFLFLFHFLGHETSCAGDPQTAVSHLGDVVLFVQYSLVKFKVSEHDYAPFLLTYIPLRICPFSIYSIETSSNVDCHHLSQFENHEFTKDNVTVSAESFSDVEVYLRAHSRTVEDVSTFNTWKKALFDTNSEGIEDNILR